MGLQTCNKNYVIIYENLFLKAYKINNIHIKKSFA